MSSCEEKKPLLVFVEHNAGLGGSVFSLLNLVRSAQNSFDPRVATFFGSVARDVYNRSGVPQIALRSRTFDSCRNASRLQQHIPGRVAGFIRELAFLSYYRNLACDLRENALVLLPALVYGNNGIRFNRGEMYLSHRHRIPTICHIRHALPLNPFDRFYSRSVDYFIAVSDYVRQIYISSGVPAGKIRTVNNGVDLNRFYPLDPGEKAKRRREAGIPEDAVVLLTASRLVAWKGLAELIDACLDLGTPPRPIELLITGDGPLKQTLMRKAEEAPSNLRIRFLGEQREMAPLFQLADILAHVPQHPDPFPRAVIEGMAAGLPVVATPLGGIPEAVNDGREGFLVPPKNRAALSAALARLVAESDLRHTLGYRGRLRAQTDFDIVWQNKAILESVADVISIRCKRDRQS